MGLSTNPEAVEHNLSITSNAGILRLNDLKKVYKTFSCQMTRLPVPHSQQKRAIFTI
jgi:hypothetical protein